MFVLVGGSTATARIPGISAAGASPELLAHTPSADLEIVYYGEPVSSSVVPVSPTGCPTPAVITRAVLETLERSATPIDGGLAQPTAAPTISVANSCGVDIRSPPAVQSAESAFMAGKSLGERLPTDSLTIGETIPGGTTTALAVLTALGERASVSSSLADNPLELKRSVVDDALTALDHEPGAFANRPIDALRTLGDPVLATVAGLTVGALETGCGVTLGGGTQMAAVAALVRHAGYHEPLTIATTSFVGADDTAPIQLLVDDLDCSLTVTDPGFDGQSHPAFDAYEAGHAKEGAGMGGALALATANGISMARVRDQTIAVYDRLLESAPVEP